ncbi:MAG: DUF4124 domain-containing protein [Luteimonas sp.]
MPRIPIRATLGLTLLLSATATAALGGEVYQWKDASGVTHYSQTPPPKGAYQLRAIGDRRGTEPAAQAATASKESPQCATARNNIEVLQGTGAVQQDSDDDGKPDKTLGPEERASQLELARATLKATCPVVAVTTKP